MIISRDNNDKYQVIDVDTGKPVTDAVILTPFTSEADFKALCEIAHADTAVDGILSEAHRYWDGVHGKGEDDAE